MGQLSYENDVYDRLRGKHHLRPIFSGGCYDMNRRLREYDPDIFIVWNIRRQQFEVHSLGNRGNTYAFDVPDNRLDVRVEEAVRRGDLRVRGYRIFREIDEANERAERSQERSRLTSMEGMAEELYPFFRRIGWEGI